VKIYFSSFDRQALADIKHFVNTVSLPPDAEFRPQWDATRQAVARPAAQARASKAFELGLQHRSEFERRLGENVEQLADLSPVSTTKVRTADSHKQPRSVYARPTSVAKRKPGVPCSVCQ
jgi:hypothetical protein